MAATDAHDRRAGRRDEAIEAVDQRRVVKIKVAQGATENDRVRIERFNDGLVERGEMDGPDLRLADQNADVLLDIGEGERGDKSLQPDPFAGIEAGLAARLSGVLGLIGNQIIDEQHARVGNPRPDRLVETVSLAPFLIDRLHWRRCGSFHLNQNTFILTHHPTILNISGSVWPGKLAGLLQSLLSRRIFVWEG